MVGERPEEHKWDTEEERQKVVQKRLAELKAMPPETSKSPYPAPDNIEGWGNLITVCGNAEGFNALLPQVKQATEAVKMLVMAEATKKGVAFNRDDKRFVDTAASVRSPAPPASPVMEFEIGGKRVPEEQGLTKEDWIITEKEAKQLRVDTYQVHVGDVELRNRTKRGQFLLLTCMVPAISKTEAVPLICWHKNSMFPELLKAMGKDCEFGIVIEEKDGETHYNIERIDRIGDVVFVDGKPSAQPTAQKMGF